MELIKKDSLTGAYDDIAHQYSPTFVERAYPLIEWVINKNFTDVEYEGLKTTDGPRLFIAQHWSYWDTIVVPYILYNHKMMPRIGAGDNLPPGFLLRRFGAFMVPRNNLEHPTKEDLVKVRKLRNYMTHLLVNDESELLFPGRCQDGSSRKTGRSIDGNHQELSSLVFTSVAEARKEGVNTQIISVNEIYERVPEDTRIFSLKKWKNRLPVAFHKSLYFLDYLRTFTPKSSKKRQSCLVVFGEPHPFDELGMNLSQSRKFFEDEIKNLYRPTSLDIPSMAVHSLGRESRYERRRLADRETILMDYFKRHGIKTYKIPEDIRDMEEKVQEIAPDIFRFTPDYAEVLNPQLACFYKNRALHLLSGNKQEISGEVRSMVRA